MDKNRISPTDTDLFWGEEPEKTDFAVSAKEEGDAIAIDRADLLRAVENLGKTEAMAEPERKTEIKEETPRPSRQQNNRQQNKRSNKKEKREVFTQPKEKGENKNGMMMAVALAALVAVASFTGLFIKLNADKKEMIAYIETELAAIKATNDAAIAEMGETLNRMETNFDEIVTLLEETGASIGSSSQESRAAITERIEKLDKQLQSLQKSLAVIQEDKNGRK